MKWSCFQGNTNEYLQTEASVNENKNAVNTQAMNETEIACNLIRDFFAKGTE